MFKYREFPEARPASVHGDKGVRERDPLPTTHTEMQGESPALCDSCRTKLATRFVAVDTVDKTDAKNRSATSTVGNPHLAFGIKPCGIDTRELQESPLSDRLRSKPLVYSLRLVILPTVLVLSLLQAIAAPPPPNRGSNSRQRYHRYAGLLRTRRASRYSSSPDETGPPGPHPGDTGKVAIQREYLIVFPY